MSDTSERRNKVRQRYRKMAKEQGQEAEQTSLFGRTQAYVDTLSKTGDHRKAIRSYCQGNKWLEENAKAVGNWPKE